VWVGGGGGAPAQRGPGDRPPDVSHGWLGFERRNVARVDKSECNFAGSAALVLSSLGRKMTLLGHHWNVIPCAGTGQTYLAKWRTAQLQRTTGTERDSTTTRARVGEAQLDCSVHYVTLPIPGRTPSPAVATLNSTNFGGPLDWRMPNVK